ncbi:MAG: capsid protein [Lachnospiraceae bacterium]|nr:capsid protein [Lachnospiraceae bacterium]
MLTPEYLESCGESAIVGIFDILSRSVVECLAKSIAKTGRVTASSRHQINQVQEAGKLMDEITEEVARITGFSNAYIQELFNEAGVKSIKYESDICSMFGLPSIKLKQSPAMMQTLAAAIEKTQGNLNNLTLTTASAAQNLFYEATNLAYMQITSGAFSYQEAIKRAIRTAAVDGGKVLYQKGHSSKLDVAVRRSVLTGVNQTAGMLTEMYADEVGCDYYETTAHAGARNIGTGYNNHESWQGQVFCISGKDRRYRKFEDATGYGQGGGLCGWNCRHSFYLFFPGLSVPAYGQAVLDEYAKRKHVYKMPGGGKIVLTEYECTQKQRAYERQIRESKALLAGYDAAAKAAPNAILENSMKEEFSAESVHLKRIEKEMKDFCRQTGRSVDSARTQVYAIKDRNGKIINFGRSVSQKAVWANRKAR